MFWEATKLVCSKGERQLTSLVNLFTRLQDLEFQLRTSSPLTKMHLMTSRNVLNSRCQLQQTMVDTPENRARSSNLNDERSTTTKMKTRNELLKENRRLRRQLRTRRVVKESLTTEQTARLLAHTAFNEQREALCH